MMRRTTHGIDVERNADNTVTSLSTSPPTGTSDEEAYRNRDPIKSTEMQQ